MDEGVDDNNQQKRKKNPALALPKFLSLSLSSRTKRKLLENHSVSSCHIREEKKKKREGKRSRDDPSY